MDITARYVLMFRWIVVFLAFGYFLHENLLFVNAHGFHWPAGGPFKFLTIWALTLSLVSGLFMLAWSYGKYLPRVEIVAMCTAVLNVMVVSLYWRYYLENPANVDMRSQIPAYEQYYIHALGPALQICDAVFVGRVFRRVRRAVLPLLSLIFAYIIWAELFVRPRSQEPVGSVTHGLPYRFLDSMDVSERLLTYAVYCAIALLVLGVLGGLNALMRR